MHCTKKLKKYGVWKYLSTENNNSNIRRGDIFYADLSPVKGSEQGGTRPVLIIQNNIGNKFSPTVIAAAITSKTSKNNVPTHIKVKANENGLLKNSVVLLEQIRTIDKRRLKEKMGSLDSLIMQKVNKALSISFGLVGLNTQTYLTPLKKRA